MFQAMFSLLKPDNNAPEFYKSFYSVYSLLQTNDIIMNELLDSLDANTQKQLIEGIITNGFDMECTSMFLKGVNPLEWYLQANEFMNLYAICEQGIKEYLMGYNIEPSKMKEVTRLKLRVYTTLRIKGHCKQAIRR